MKKLLFLVIIMMMAVLSFCQNWKKISLNTSEDLKKIIVLNNQTIIFSKNHCWVSQGRDLTKWNRLPIPESSSISPVVFQGKIFINSDGPLYISEDNCQTWQAISVTNVVALAANKDAIFAFKNGTGTPCLKSNDGISFSTLSSLVVPDGFQQPPTSFYFAKAMGDTIIASSFHPLSMYGTYRSYDGGNNWQYVVPEYGVSVNDFTLIRGQLEEVGHHSSIPRLIALGYFNLFAEGGELYAVESTDQDNWFAGSKISQGNIEEGGMIMRNLDVTHIFLCPEIIRALKYNGTNVIAVGNQGAVYILGDIISTVGKVCQTENLYIYPNPTTGSLTINVSTKKKITIFNISGTELMNLFPQEKKIDLKLPSPGIYFIKQGEEAKKVIVI